MIVLGRLNGLVHEATVEFDPYSLEFFNDPFEIYRGLRDEAPVYHNEKRGFYALSRFQDVLDASVDFRTFSSAKGILIEDLPPEFLEATPMMIMMDPPRSTRLRKLISKAFTARKSIAFEPEIRERARRIVDELAPRGSCDFVKDFAAVLPMEIISSLLGVPDEDRVAVRQRADASLTRDVGNAGLPPAALKAMAEMNAYFVDLIEERRKRPKEDLISQLLAAELEEEGGRRRKLTDPELLGFVGLVAGGGNETTTKLLGSAAVLFWRHPDVRAEMVRNPSLIPQGCEEALRYWPPSHIQGRSATRDVEIHGCVIPKDSRVLLLTAAACRDEREFEDPDRFDMNREIPIQIALGHGIHKCLGSYLARLEARVAFEEFFARIPEYEVDEENCERVHMTNVAGYSSIPISF
jgi:cytochrome P450